MKITSISAQVRDPNRVNISVDGKYRFSLSIAQVVEIGLKIGADYNETELAHFETESQFGKLYATALEYTVLRPHSAKEIKDYLWRKTRATKYKSRTGEIKEREGITQELANRVFERLLQKGYIDDEKFTRWWVDNRHLKKGTSQRKLIAELRLKGVANAVIEASLANSPRTDEDELRKMIEKKQVRYNDPQKLMQYLVRQGFSYDAVKAALRPKDEDRY